MGNVALLVDINWDKNTNIEVDTKVAAKVAKATSLAKKLGKKGFERISPPIKLSNKAKPIRRPKFDPIEEAENNLKQVSTGFKMWLEGDLAKLKLAFRNYATNPDNKELFTALSDAIHTIKGNAPILGCDAAGMLASSLTDLFEGCADYSKMRTILTLALNSIYHAMEHNVSKNDPVLLDTIDVLTTLKSKCKSAIKKKTNQAAGSESCTTGTPTLPSFKCISSTECPGACPGSGN